MKFIKLFIIIIYLAVSVGGSVRCCRRCSRTIQRREAILQFQQRRRAGTENRLRLVCDSLFALRRDLEAALSQFFDARAAVHMIDGFEEVDEDDNEERKPKGAVDDRGGDDFSIEWNEGDEQEAEEEENVSENTATASKTATTSESAKGKKKEKVLPAKFRGDGDADPLRTLAERKEAVVGLLLAYQRKANDLLRWKPGSRAEATIIRNLKKALSEFQDDVILPFQKVPPGTTVLVLRSNRADDCSIQQALREEGEQS